MTPSRSGFQASETPYKNAMRAQWWTERAKWKKCRARLSRRAYGAARRSRARPIARSRQLLRSFSAHRLESYASSPGLDQKPNNFGFAQIDLALKAKLPKYA